MDAKYHLKLSTYAELISEDFGSTFTVYDDNVLLNLLGHPGDFDEIRDIVAKYIPGAKLEFIKTNNLSEEYDIYEIHLVKTTEH